MKGIEASAVTRQAREAARYIARAIRESPLRTSERPLPSWGSALPDLGRPDSEAQGGQRPSLGLVLGSGWASAGQGLSVEASLDYQDIPHFPVPQVQGHPGRLVFGRLSGRPAVVLCGRPHTYEGYTMSQAAFPVLVLRELGVTDVVLTNAAGGLDPSFQPGDLMLVTDHINLPGLAGANPLAGLERPFVDMGLAYDPALNELAVSVASSLGETLRQGVYAMVGGPTYETAAEARLLRSLGADAVGMSTVPEAVMARWAGLRVLALSLITNVVPAARGGAEKPLLSENRSENQPSDSRPFPGPEGGAGKPRLSEDRPSDSRPFPGPEGGAGKRRPSESPSGPNGVLTHEEVLRRVEEAAPRLRRFLEALAAAWPA